MDQEEALKEPEEARPLGESELTNVSVFERLYKNEKRKEKLWMEPEEYILKQRVSRNIELARQHDQLPNVEEYKASIGHISSGKSGSFLKRDRDPEGLEGLKLSDMIQEEDFFLGDQERIKAGSKHKHNHDQFEVEGKDNDSQETYQYPPSSGSCFWKGCAIATFLTLIVVLLVITSAIMNDEDPVHDIFHWDHGDTDRYIATMKYVSEIRRITDIEVFDDTNSPQYLAAQWMAHGDPMEMSVPEGNSQDRSYDERYAYVVLYFSLGGPRWSHSLNFLSGNHICSWFEEFKIPSNDPDIGDQPILYGLHDCRESSPGLMFPTSVYIPNNGIDGSIPKEIHALSHVKYLNLEFNTGLVGTLQTELFKLPNLDYLALQWCNMEGTVPTEIGQATKLKYLGLGDNKFRGTMPDEIAQLVNLELLGLDDNGLYGNIEVFRTLTKLKSLFLEHNLFSGTISDALMASWPELEEFDLSDLDLEGELPVNFFNHQNNLEVIDLHGNQLSGPLPDEIHENEKLEFLALHENAFGGELPPSLLNLKKLRHLDISSNAFASKFPIEMELMTTLEYLFTATNNFGNGEIPKFLIEMTNLRELSMKQNQLTGSIPEFLEYLTKLEFLDFNNNQLEGTIPRGLSKLTELRHLILKANELRGTLPDEMKNLIKLELLLLEQNGLEGDAEVLCSTGHTIDTFVIDCGHGYSNETVFNCTCCSSCCDKGDAECNYFDWRGNLDPVWEYGYRRKRYSYDLGPDVWVLP